MSGTFTSLKGKVVVITGGTRGIGFAAVKAFLKEGAKVAMFGSRQETVDKAMTKLMEENADYPVKGYHPDLTDSQAVRDVIAEIEKEFGIVDVLINNAGVSDATPLLQYDDEHFDKVMDINVTSALNMIRAVAPSMKEHGGGNIINTSSVVSLYAQKSGVAYPTSKFAINGMTKSLARELGPMHIRVNAVAPGIIATDMVAALDQKLIAGMAAGIPVQRLGEPEDIANAFLFLASDLASYISGAVLSVDGAIII